MDPKDVLEQIENFQTTGEDCSEWIEQENLCENSEFNRILIYLLTKDKFISNSQKLLIICFMKQYKILFLNRADINLILPFLNDEKLNYTTSQLIVAHFDSFNEFYDFLESTSDQSPSFFLILLNTFIERKEFEENSIENVQKTVSVLNSCIRDYEIEFKIRLQSVKCMISLSRSIQNEETIFLITKMLFEIFIEYPSEEENKPIFYAILRMRSLLEKLNQVAFYQKVQELMEFFSQKGPSIGIDNCSFIYYLCQIIFHVFERINNIEKEEEESDDNLENILILPPDRLVFILLLFSVYHEDEIKQWTTDVEDFFSCNSNYLLTEEKDEDEDDNSMFKESHELHRFIYSEIIRLGKFHFDESTELLYLAIQTSLSMIGTEIPNYSTTLINMSSILFLYNLEPVIQHDTSKYIETSDDISVIYFILYLSKNKIEYDDITSKIEYFLDQEPEMFKILVASILINYNIESINPDLYSLCFVQCLEIISSFNTEEVTGILNLLFSLANFENKPLIVPGFENQMQNIMEYLINNLVLFQNAYQSTASLCNLIAHFIRYIHFQDELLPFFLNFIYQICSNASYANLGIQLECAILNCKSSRSSFNENQLKEFHHTFVNQLKYFDLDYLCENLPIIPSILLISNFFAKNEIIDEIDEWIFTVFSCDRIPSQYFDKISPLVISFIKNENSSNKYEILKIMMKRSDLFSDKNDENPLLYPTIAVLAHLSIDNTEHFELLMMEFHYNLIDILTAINKSFKANLDIRDDRLILVMLSIFGEQQIYVDDSYESTENLNILNQVNALNFFGKVIKLIQTEKLNELQKSSFFDQDDDVFNTKLMSCSFSKLLNNLIPDSQEYSIIQCKKKILNILVGKNL